MIELTQEQQEIHDNLIDWVDQYYKGKHDMEYITLSGFAGTGKTSLLSVLAETVRGKYRIAFVTYTGKASVVLSRKLGHVIGYNDTISTIHSLIYKPMIDPKIGKIEGWMKKEGLDCNLIIIDEASMISKDLWKDLLSYDIPIIAVGDSGQLTPVSKDEFSLMENPDFSLETIHRQAQDSPIIQMSMEIRNTGTLETKIYGKGVACLDYDHPTCQGAIKNTQNDTESQILCGMNVTRVKLNKKIRRFLGFHDEHPMTGEKLICLKNNKNADIVNGQQGFIHSVQTLSDKSYSLNMKMDGSELSYMTCAPKEIFNKPKVDNIYQLEKDPVLSMDAIKNKTDIDFFDYGYAISVHKSQGSEWGRVILIEEYNQYQSDEDRKKWLYTAVTRSRSKLLIIRNYY